MTMIAVTTKDDVSLPSECIPHMLKQLGSMYHCTACKKLLDHEYEAQPGYPDRDSRAIIQLYSFL